ncbi:HSPB1-associated protein 1 isoform X4 [Rhinoderma darwinii]|uniref:HSPB1-associated protein 1 isoform X4 n=1 Tax=Rhinoderma darwinii TaxID=43563 RepID=UPI003F67F1D7
MTVCPLPHHRRYTLFTVVVTAPPLSSRDAVPKPFTPQEARDLILGVARPAVFLNMTDDWPASRWTLTRLCDVLQEQTLRFRIGRRKMDTEPQFETQCDYVDGTIRQFQEWISGNCQEESGPFGRFDSAESWAYADYKYLALLFKDKAEMLQDVSWADFGFPGRDGRDSTLWVGSRGANTPCHIDSYGCNLVLQVQGRKKWHLFPPEDTTYLYPTRIPYEESSIFSKVNVVNPDQQHYPAFSKARPHVVTLDPGQVLVVPRRWWHYVESVDDVTVSVNSWLELIMYKTDKIPTHRMQWKIVLESINKMNYETTLLAIIDALYIESYEVTKIYLVRRSEIDRKPTQENMIDYSTNVEKNTNDSLLE